MAIQQTLDPLAEKIAGIVAGKLEPKAYIDVSRSGVRDNIHVLVISRQFDEMNDRQRQDYLWDVIDTSDLSEPEKLRISMLLALSPDNLK